MCVQVVTEDGAFRDAVRQSVEVAGVVDVHAHAAVNLTADVLVVDAESTPAGESETLASSDSRVTIVVAPEIDADVRERGRRLNATAYVRKDDEPHKVIGLVIELASFSR